VAFVAKASMSGRKSGFGGSAATVVLENGQVHKIGKRGRAREGHGASRRRALRRKARCHARRGW
jgi:hypothetical protein